uniref:Secreted protein n=1 Tax=Streptomyces sp. NBC_01393 TaxID=2903851 RepID=A0AAU3HW85_9ACTN
MTPAATVAVPRSAPLTARFARASLVALLVTLGFTVPAPASAAPAATSCYGGAVTVHYGEVRDFGPYVTTSRCTDINMRMTGGDAEFGWACVQFARAGACNYWTKIGRSWTTIATDVLNGTRFTVPNGVDLEGSSATFQIAF